MNIGINALILKEQNTGTGYYSKSLIEEIIKYKEHNFFIFVKDKKLLNIKKNNVKIVEIPFANRGVIQRIISEQFLLKRYVKKYKLDIIHSTSFTIPLNIKKIPNIVTVHDMFHVLFKQTIKPLARIYYLLFYNFCIKKADFLIADSENTRKDINKLMNIDINKIKTIHLGVNQLFLNYKVTDDLKGEFIKLGLENDYILYVGSLEPRKNIKGVIESFNLIHTKIKEDLVIVGASKWKDSELIDLVDKYKLRTRIKFTGYLDERLLPLIYQNAKVLFFPSYYEGFGFPVIEAMSQGIPVITSANSSLEEIARGACILVNPYDKKEMSEKLYKLLKNDNMIRELSHKGKEKSKEFYWGKTAHETLDLYKKAMRKG